MVDKAIVVFGRSGLQQFEVRPAPRENRAAKLAHRHVNSIAAASAAGDGVIATHVFSCLLFVGSEEGRPPEMTTQFRRPGTGQPIRNRFLTSITPLNRNLKIHPRGSGSVRLRVGTAECVLNPDQIFKE
jgi:hypothetical protein